MGTDLSLLPDSWNIRNDRRLLAYNRISLSRDYTLFARILPGFRGIKEPNPLCIPKDIPKGMSVDIYEDDGITETKVDSYGDKLTYVTAGELGKISTRGTSHWNKAVLKMMRALPKDTQIILYWH